MNATAALEVDVYLAGLVDSPAELGVQEARARAITTATGAYVGFASFAGPTGGGYPETAGRSSIWGPTGSLIARAGTKPDDLARATLTF